jgi:hypothetical protein
VKFSCEKCGRSYVADEKVRGRAFKMKCKQCGNLIVVKPSSTSPTPTPGSIPVVSPQPSSTTPAGIELEGGQDPFASSTSPDPFAPPAGDPFAIPSPDPFAPATAAGRPSFDPFAEPPPPEPAFGANGASRGQQQAPPAPDEAEAAFADLSREMASDDDAPIERGFAPITPEPVAVPQAPAPPVRFELPTPAPRPIAPAPVRAPVAAPPPPAVARASAPAPAKKSLGPVLGIAAALIVVGGGAAFFLLRSPEAKPEAKPAAPPPVVAAERPERSSPPQVASAPAVPLQPAPPVPERKVEKAPPPAVSAEVPRDEPRAAKQRPVEKATPPPARKKEARAPEPPKAPPQKVVAAPAPPAPEPRQDAPKVAIAPKSSPARDAAASSTTPVSTGFGRTNPAAPPVSTNAELPPLDEGKVEATFAKYARNFDACVTAAREGEPGIALNGRTVNVTMTVNPNGKVLYPTLDDVELNTTDLGKCIKKESGKIQFPAFGGEPIRVRKPIVLK